MATFDFLFKGQFSFFSYIVLSVFAILLMYLFMLACQLSGICVKFMLWVADRWDDLVDRFEGVTVSSGNSSPNTLSSSASSSSASSSSASQGMSEEAAESRAAESSSKESDGEEETVPLNRDKKVTYGTISP
ncbi:uncharacterized protein [Macrobrachium rosenbergii]|uniref:uncharacterized protein n=1 Tax=Macrobrachium rosenbergii TaxID=79674 RepID=UPI0034D6FD37